MDRQRDRQAKRQRQRERGDGQRQTHAKQTKNIDRLDFQCIEASNVCLKPLSEAGGGSFSLPCVSLPRGATHGLCKHEERWERRKGRQGGRKLRKTRRRRR